MKNWVKLQRKFQGFSIRHMRGAIIITLFAAVCAICVRVALSPFTGNGSATSGHVTGLNLIVSSHAYSGWFSWNNKRIGIYYYVTTNWTVTLENVMDTWDVTRISLPSLCNGAKSGYNYNINLIYHPSDLLIEYKDFRLKLERLLNNVILKNCSTKVQSAASLNFHRSPHRIERMGWAIAEKVWKDYIGGTDYFYVMSQQNKFPKNWVSSLISEMTRRAPSNFGILYSGCEDHVFHKTHLETFGWTYPRGYRDKIAFQWIRWVYPENFSTRIEHGENCQENKSDTSDSMKQRLGEDNNSIQVYYEYKSRKSPIHYNEKRVISMTLFGTNERYVNNAVRNAQLAKIVFPGWTLRFYVAEVVGKHHQKDLPIPERLKNKLQDHGAEIVYVNMTKIHVPPFLWRFLVADDESVDIFIVRDCDSLLIKRDALVVGEWLSSEAAFHCVRDHPTHAYKPLMGGLWGARREQLANILKKPLMDMIGGEYTNKYLQDSDFLTKEIWPKVRDYSFCHDCVSCTQWPSSHPFPLPRHKLEHVGATFDQYGLVKKVDNDILASMPVNEKCCPHN